MVAIRVGVLVAVALGCASLAAAETRNIDRTLPLSATGTVALDAHNGWVQIRTWDRPEVEVQVRIRWFGLSSSSYRFRETTVDVSGSADRVSIKWNPADRYGWTWSLFDWGWAGPDVRYDITAPRNARFDIRTHNANTDIRDVSGLVHLDTHNGGSRIANLGGPLELSTHNGWARVDFASFTGDSRITTHNGWVELSLPSSSKFNLDARGHHISVRSDFPVTRQASWDRRSRDATGSINGGGPALRFNAHNGSLRVRSK